MAVSRRGLVTAVGGAAVGTLLAPGLTGLALGRARETSFPVGTTPDQPAPAPHGDLAPLKWAPRNRAYLERLIADCGYGSSHYNPAQKPYAVFDWDNTCIAGDCEETLMRYAASHFRFALSPQEFARAIALDVPPRPLDAALTTTAGKPVSLSAIQADLLADYTELAARSGPIPADNPALLSLKSKLLFAYDAIDASYSADVSCRWIVRLFGGWTREQLAAMAKASNLWHLGQAMRHDIWATPAQRPGRAGLVACPALTALRLTPEIADLQATLRRCGIDVFVCSASLEDIVAVFATDPDFGYNLPRENVMGIRMTWPDGKLGLETAPGWPVTVKAGKVAALRAALADRRGYGPVLVCGDSSGDYAMMTAFAETRHALIVNRCLGGEIGQLCAKAAVQMNEKHPRFLLQGRDGNTGEWRPSEQAIKLGENTPCLLAGKA
ncbi:MAG: haloacid dehalogenase-like hydrolase [Acetobacter sp.]|uniref:haloacid dehalogenase-like hydrolase n=1 Tax=Acetobacter sp. TaxID=440 RepID=UPI0039EADB74